MAYVKKDKQKKPGVITLYFKGEASDSKVFNGVSKRNKIIESWKQQYRIGKVKGEIFYQVYYYENSKTNY